MQARHHVILGKLKAEALGVVVHDLDILELQRDEALVAAGQCLLDADAGDGSGSFLDLGLGLLCGTRTSEVVGASTDRGGANGVQQGVGGLLRALRRRGGGLRCVFAELLRRTISTCLLKGGFLETISAGRDAEAEARAEPTGTARSRAAQAGLPEVTYLLQRLRGLKAAAGGPCGEHDVI